MTHPYTKFIYSTCHQKTGLGMIKDYRFIPLEEHEPVEMDDDFDEETVLEQYDKKDAEKYTQVRLFTAS
jgi:hypothetical protein